MARGHVTATHYRSVYPAPLSCTVCAEEQRQRNDALIAERRLSYNAPLGAGERWFAQEASRRILANARRPLPDLKEFSYDGKLRANLEAELLIAEKFGEWTDRQILGKYLLANRSELQKLRTQQDGARRVRAETIRVEPSPISQAAQRTLDHLSKYFDPHQWLPQLTAFARTGEGFGITRSLQSEIAWVTSLTFLTLDPIRPDLAALLTFVDL